MARLINALEQIFDSAGEPLVEGLLDFYEAGGSTTRKDTYADSAETIANPNPVVLNGDGRCPNVFGTGTYRVILRTAAGSQILQRDPVGGDQSLTFGADWISAQVYAASDVVRDDGQYWESQTSGNTGNQPSLDGGTNWLLFLADVATNTTNIATNTADIATNTADIATNAADILAISDTSLSEARLTLTTALPVTVGDVTAATNIYLTPFKGNRISLYSGSAWSTLTFTEITAAVPATTDTNYDVFVYDSSGVTVELVAWSSDTARATALTTQDGIYVKSGDTTRRYVGTFRTTGVSGQTEDSKTKRFVWNYYNRVNRVTEVLESTDSWTYSTATVRQANASTANQFEYVTGLSEDLVSALIQVMIVPSLSNNYSVVGVGVDSTTVFSGIYGRNSQGNGGSALSTGLYKDTALLGYHYVAWLEYVETGTTTTFYGDNGGPTLVKSGMTGEIMG